MIAAVVFDVGETLVDETRHWGEWADWLGVLRRRRLPHLRRGTTLLWEMADLVAIVEAAEAPSAKLHGPCKKRRA